MRLTVGILILALCAGAAVAERPAVLIIGDSISIGYTPFVREALSNRMDVVHAPGNNSSTVVGLEKIDAWLGTRKWDVIHFNWGLHDLKYIDPATTKMVNVNKGERWVSVEQYEKNLRTLVRRMKLTGAKLIWCSTTPVPDGVTTRVPGDEVPYNAAAARVMSSEGVAVNDLCAVVGNEAQRLAMGGMPRNVHYTREGSRALAVAVVKSIEAVLRTP